jgi:putative chitinase
MTKGLEKKYKVIFNVYGINTYLRLSHFFAQYYAECGLVPKRESLYYTSIKSLRTTFKTPFKGKSDAFVSQYLRNTEKCANYVYANRGGNRDEASGDGFKYRGAGGFQHTSFNQFHQMSIDLGLDFLENPELLLEDYYAILGACWYWQKNNLNKFADNDNLDAISDIINIGRLTDKVGDANGFEHRKIALMRFKKYFKA